jgi:hypothetical protein
MYFFLLEQARLIQRRLVSGTKKQEAEKARKFSNLMFEGKVNSAIRMLCRNDNKGILPLSDETIQELKKKHSRPSGISEETLLNGPIHEVDETNFYKIDEDICLMHT